MKFTLIALSLLFSTLAQADLAQVHQRNCETLEAKNLVSQGGSCRIVIAPKKFSKSVMCMGKFLEMYVCRVTFASGILNMTCGVDLNTPVMNQDMEAEGLSYNVATILKNAGGREVILHDEVEYGLISNSALSILMVGKDADITLRFEQSQVSLTEVVCQ